MQRRAVLVFVKFPLPGRVKTRLARTLGDDAAVEIYRRLVDRVFEILASAPLDEVHVLFDPPGAESEAAVRAWLAPALGKISQPVHFFAQHPGDLGERLSQGFEQAFDSGADAVAAIGTDCVAIGGGTFASTWRLLGEGNADADTDVDADTDAVFGPTHDGGYYLVAMKAMHAGLFEAIPWSSSQTLAESLQKAQQLELDVEKLEVLSDVDHAADWEVARAEFFADLEDPETT